MEIQTKRVWFIPSKRCNDVDRNTRWQNQRITNQSFVEKHETTTNTHNRTFDERRCDDERVQTAQTTADRTTTIAIRYRDEFSEK